MSFGPQQPSWQQIRHSTPHTQLHLRVNSACLPLSETRCVKRWRFISRFTDTFVYLGISCQNWNAQVLLEFNLNHFLGSNAILCHNPLNLANILRVLVDIFYNKGEHIIFRSGIC